MVAERQRSVGKEESRIYLDTGLKAREVFTETSGLRGVRVSVLNMVNCLANVQVEKSNVWVSKAQWSGMNEGLIL